MQSKRTRILVEGAVMLALATALSYIRIYKLPWGGSITLFSMLPIVLFSIRRGLKAGLAVSFLFSLIQFFQGIGDGLFGWGLTPFMLIACILLDYIIAFTVLGLGGLFRKKKTAGWIGGIVIAIALAADPDILICDAFPERRGYLGELRRALGGLLHRQHSALQPALQRLVHASGVGHHDRGCCHPAQHPSCT